MIYSICELVKFNNHNASVNFHLSSGSIQQVRVSVLVHLNTPLKFPLPDSTRGFYTE